jgi:hypothetical protein
MTTGAPTSEFNSYGGYAAVKAMYDANGGTTSRDEISAADKTKYANVIANTGVGDLQLLKETNTPLTTAGRTAMTANGVDTYTGAALTAAGIPFKPNTDDRLDTLTTQYGLLNTQYGTLTTSYQDLLKQFAALKTSSAATTTAAPSMTTSIAPLRTTSTATTPSTVINSGVVNTGASNTSGIKAASSTGAVYGPDGTAYSGPAAAIAAGVYNYTMFPPTGAGQPEGVVNNSLSTADTQKLSGVTGNYFGGVNQNPDNPWVNLYPPK